MRCVRAPENSLVQTSVRVVRVAMAQFSCSFWTYCGSKCDFSSRWPGRQQLMPLSSCADDVREHLREVKVSQTCVVSEKVLILARAGIWRFWRPRFYNMPQTSCRTWGEIQTFNEMPESSSRQSEAQGWERNKSENGERNQSKVEHCCSSWRR